MHEYYNNNNNNTCLQGDRLVGLVSDTIKQSDLRIFSVLGRK